MKFFNDKKTRYRNLLLVLLPLFLIAGFFGYRLYADAMGMFNGGGTEEEIEKSPQYSLPEYGYQLRANCTEIQFEYFQNLLEAIANEDEETAAKEVGRSFIADFYTWSNKAGQYDVGGMNYVYSPQLANIYVGARDDFYHYLNYYIDKYGAENLMEVENVEILECRKLDNGIVVDEKTHPCWFMRAQWTYKDSTFDTTGFETLQDMYVIRNVDSGRFEIVQIYGME